MSSIPRFAAYAAAFEKAYASDDWSVVEPFFTEDAEYEVGFGPPFTLGAGSLVEGRAAILAHFRHVLDGFDRRFATRDLKLLDGPREDAGAVWIRGSARYTAPGVPSLEFALEETATFDGERIRRLEDRYDDAERARMLDYLDTHGAKLGIASAKEPR